MVCVSTPCGFSCLRNVASSCPLTASVFLVASQRYTLGFLRGHGHSVHTGQLSAAYTGVSVAQPGCFSTAMMKAITHSVGNSLLAGVLEASQDALFLKPGSGSRMG